MPQYRFHFEADAFFTDETDPVELPDDDAARTHAIRVAGELAKNNRDLNRVIVVTNEEGRLIFKVRLREALGA